MNLYESITNNLKESEEFNPEEFERYLSNNMRYKVFDTHESDPDVPENSLYWVTQGPFNRDELEQFQKALKNYTTFDTAYVTLRDLSGYDYLHDKGKEVLASVGLENYDANPYIKASLAIWPDWDFNGEPYRSKMKQINESINYDDIVLSKEQEKIKEDLKTRLFDELLNNYKGFYNNIISRLNNNNLKLFKGSDIILRITKNDILSKIDTVEKLINLPEIKTIEDFESYFLNRTLKKVSFSDENLTMCELCYDDLDRYSHTFGFDVIEDLKKELEPKMARIKQLEKIIISNISKFRAIGSFNK